MTRVTLMTIMTIQVLLQKNLMIPRILPSLLSGRGKFDCLVIILWTPLLFPLPLLLPGTEMLTLKLKLRSHSRTWKKCCCLPRVGIANCLKASY